MILALSPYAAADEIGFRYNNTVDSTGMFDTGFSNAGKLLQLKYDWDYDANFFIEGASGAYFSGDLNSPAYWVSEASVGAKVSMGPVTIRISQGAGVFVLAQSPTEFPTHLGVDFTDLRTGFSIGLERSHYSNGSSGGYDMTGLVLSTHF